MLLVRKKEITKGPRKMISAKQAKEQSENNKVKRQIDEIEKSIKKAIGLGRTQIFVTGELLKETLETLKESDYCVKRQQNGNKISWG